MGKTVLRVVYNELTQKKELVFLHSNSIPISSVTFGPIDDEYVKWRCSLNPHVFIEPGFQFEEERHLSYLGFVVKIPALGINEPQDIDLSDWVNELKWKGALTTNGEPTLKEIFVLWSFTSGESYFHCLNEIHVEYITNMGDIHRKGLNE